MLVSSHAYKYPGRQAAIRWRASGTRQISLNASAERAFANFRDKNIVFYTFLQQKRPALALTALC